MAKTFVIGDIHGAHIPLQQCLDRCGFDYENDTLITIGDICDGWKYVYECVEILLKIKNRIDLEGNHDRWFRWWLETMNHPDKWAQGGKGTAMSYLRAAGKDENEYLTEIRYSFGYGKVPLYEFPLDPMEIPVEHIQFFKGQRLYYKDDKNRLFVHAGFKRTITLKLNQQKDQSNFLWDRDLWHDALSVHPGDNLAFTEDFSEIFIGHTQTVNWWEDETYTPEGKIIIPGRIPMTKPMHADIIWNLDTGAGSVGKLTIMDVDTHEYWQSDPVKDIYGDYKPRG